MEAIEGVGRMSLDVELIGGAPNQPKSIKVWAGNATVVDWPPT